ncbi:XRE family transcriptional regulator [Atopobiaceae bacterium 24-176]
MAHTTENLMAALEDACSVDAYLERLATSGKQAPRNLADYLNALLESRRLSRPAVIRDAGLNATFGYQVFQGTRRVSRNNALLLAFALSCSLTETQRLLALANVGRLAPQDPRDAVIIWCLERSMSRQEADEELFRLGMTTLSPSQ